MLKLRPFNIILLFSRHKIGSLLVVGSFSLFWAGNATATPVIEMITFKFSNFEAGGIAPPPLPPVPQDLVTGSVTLTFEPFSAGFGFGPVAQVDAIDLTIAGHTYSASEVNFQYPFGSDLLIGAFVPSSLQTGFTDFTLRLSVPEFALVARFQYTNVGTPGDGFDHYSSPAKSCTRARIACSSRSGSSGTCGYAAVAVA
jgi:hypothetical protein